MLGLVVPESETKGTTMLQSLSHELEQEPDPQLSVFEEHDSGPEPTAMYPPDSSAASMPSPNPLEWGLGRVCVQGAG